MMNLLQLDNCYLDVGNTPTNMIVRPDENESYFASKCLIIKAVQETCVIIAEKSNKQVLFI